MRLKTLHIKNFRCFKDFEVNRLGQVNLIVGKNNSGKSSVLEAIRIYAGRGSRQLLNEIASEHDEVYRSIDLISDESIIEMPYENFFHGRVYPSDDSGAIYVGEKTKSKSALTINHVYFVEYDEEIVDEDGDTYTRTRRKIIPKTENIIKKDREVKQALTVSTGSGVRYYELNNDAFRRGQSLSLLDKNIPCAYIPTQFISIDELADIWDKVLFTEYEEIVVKGLQIISQECENIAFVKTDSRNQLAKIASTKEIRRSAKIKMRGLTKALPLNSMGDGMLRVLQLILKTLPATNGFLLIDEFENGLHYSVQEQVWSLLFELAVKYNIQIFATTHSWDCVESFAKVSKERTDVEGVLFRVGRSVLKSEKDKTIAIVFDEDNLANITQSDVEVR